MSKSIAVYIIIAIAPAILYRGYRPPRGLSPDVRNYGNLVRLISTTLLKPIMAFSGVSFALSAFLYDIGKEEIAAFFLVIGIILFTLMGIPGVISFIQFYDLNGRK